MPIGRSRGTYQEAARRLLRDSVLDAVRELLDEKEWSDITMAEVARNAGVSRQTLYNEFESRQGVAQQYILRLVDHFLDEVNEAVVNHPGDARGAISDAFQRFLSAATQDPAVRWALLGRAKAEILSLITTDGWPVLERAVERLAQIMQCNWPKLNEREAQVTATYVGRIALSFIAIPPMTPDTMVEDFTDFVTPYLENAYALARGEASQPQA
ncbi:TetR family transcriptional regulator [Hoyosella rhizosphaerae]|uniref:TetR family transcriptional regulator n=1 Tax=Hoyosella rhizosphaerae TaxID=1755582 RepID=A0A916UAI9_9ACTN|nr:TetR family transcriptional regulator [Hoyosella rhizosphaerae]MBN4925998.1 TetR family transcriptional regulator [Hoyosella rhizosphaerae]GGC66365.1 TetR family transcriptional regulator [Hoyosella rhizosphaerae]